jgi:hypothetical protein
VRIADAKAGVLLRTSRKNGMSRRRAAGRFIEVAGKKMVSGS